MDVIQCGFAADTDFGPSVSPCRRDFDFTILFEEVVLVIVPACTFVILAIASLLSLHRARTLVRHGRLYWIKLFCAAALSASQIAVLVVQTQLANKTAASIPSAVTSLVATIFIPVVSHFEHLKSLRPASLLVVFLSLTCLFEATRTRTHWLNGEAALAATLSVALGIRLIALYFEIWSKRELLLAPDEKVADELLAGPISRTVFHWLNRLMAGGYRGVLHLEEFGPIDDRLLTARLRPKFRGIGSQYGSKADISEQEGSSTGNRLIWLTFFALGRTWAAPVIARLAVTAFTFTQPFLANAALAYLEADYPIPASHGYGLIGAAFLCYVGIAAATGWYWHQAFRCAVMIRGGLAIAIFEKLLRLPEGDKLESMATTLMVADLQRIMQAVAHCHEVWAGTIDTGLATWLLYRQLGPSCFVMLGVAAISGLGSMQIMKKTGASQQKWLAATQKRLKRTKQVLDSLKGIKMTSQTSVAYQTLTKLRNCEIKDSSSFRWFMVVTNILSYCPLTLSPPLIFGVYVGTAGSGYDFSVSKVFTSLVIITLLSAPLVRLFQVIPQLGGAYGCFQRLHEFLLLEERIDFRKVMPNGDSEAGGRNTPAADTHIMSLRDVSLGWSPKSSPILTNINFEIKKGAKIAIIGSVGTGKTLLLKGLIGEAYKTDGQLTLAPSISFAYCSQTPWLENVSAQQNIIQYGREASDSGYYRQLALDCALDDLIRLPTFASGPIGSGGVMLSGGQRQRLALARALATKNDVLLLDDVFSALDRRTRWRVANMLFNRTSINAEKTTIYTTHDERIANLADEVYQIDEWGHLSRRPDLGLASLTAAEGQLSDPPLMEFVESLEAADHSSTDNKYAQTSAKAQAPLDAVERETAKQMLGDRTVYKTYFKSVGLLHSTVFLVGAMAWSVSFKFSDIWVRWWSDASAAGDNNRLGYWLGTYAALGVLPLVVLCAWLYHQQFNVITRSGKHLHGQLVTTVLRAQFPVISQVDTGTTLNRFSQDLMFVDMQLPIDLSNTASELFTATIQIVLIAVASVPALCAIPVMFIVLYLVQHFYLRTSKQLRLFELEATAALVTKISETGSGAGLSTIRAHGWSDVTMARFLEKLDRSQEPVYLLYAAQRWLQLVLNMIIAGLVVAVLGASIALKSSNRVSPGAVGVAFLNAVTLGETLTQLIIAWTGLETSLGAIARIALFQRQTPAEEEEDSVRGVSRDPGGCGGAIRFENVWATYNPPSSEIPTTTTAAEKEETSMTPPGLGHGGPDREWSLRGITLSINPGERIAICGRTGSGKSTMHLALLRMVYTPIGSVFIDGVDHFTLSLEALRNRFLVISQDKLEGFDTLRQALDPHGVFSDARVEAVLRECGMLDVVMRSYGGLAARREDCRFSAGEEQLLRVARVVLDVERENSGAPDGDGKGRIVLLDEVTSSIDKKTEEKIEFLLKTRLGGRTLIAINHRLEAVLNYDRVVVLDNGMVVDVGTPAELVVRCGLFKGLKVHADT